MFPDHCDNGLLTLPLRLLDYQTEDLETFRSVETKEASLPEWYTVYVTGVYCHTLQRLSSNMADMVEVRNQVMIDTLTGSRVLVSTENNR